MSTDRAPSPDRRTFLRNAGLGVTAVGALLGAEAAGQSSVSRQLTDAEKLSRLASTCWPPRHLFKTSGRATPNAGDRWPCGRSTARSPMLDSPEVDEGHLPGRLPPRPLVGRVRRPGRRRAVHGDDRRAQRPIRDDAALGPVAAVVEEVGREAGGDRRRDEQSSASTSRTTRPRTWPTPTTRSARRASASPRSGWTLAAVLGAKTMRANTGVIGHADHARGRGTSDRLSRRTTKIVVYLKQVHRVVQGTGGLRRRRWA